MTVLGSLGVARCMVGLARDRVRLESHDPAWRDHFEAEASRLLDAVGDWLLAVEHVGSTAVEGLPAKPVVDVLAAVPDESTARSLVPVLEPLGYEHHPDDDVADRVFLAKGPREDRTVYCSLAPVGSDTYCEQLAFRDALRADPQLRSEYAALKRRLAAEHPDDREAYTDGKTPFVEQVLEETLPRG